MEDGRTVPEERLRLLKERGWKVQTARDLSQGMFCLSELEPDVIVLDAVHSDRKGSERVSALRQKGIRIPIMLIADRQETQDMVLALRNGANDYISEPFDEEILYAKMQALIRSVEQIPETLVKGAIRLKLLAMTAEIDGMDILLTQKEFLLLMLFVQHENQLLSAEYLYERIWNTHFWGNKSTIKRHIAKIRKKLLKEGSGYTITSEYGKGYRFESITSDAEG